MLSRDKKVSLKELEFRLRRIVPTPKISKAAVRWEQVKLALKIRGKEIGEALLQQDKDDQQQSEDVNFDDADVLELLPDNSDSGEDANFDNADVLELLSDNSEDSGSNV